MNPIHTTPYGPGRQVFPRDAAGFLVGERDGHIVYECTCGRWSTRYKVATWDLLDAQIDAAGDEFEEHLLTAHGLRTIPQDK
jgi:hypothetical protein